MIKKISILVNYNLYESKRYFAKKFAEALERKGLTVHLIDSGDESFQKQIPIIVNPALTDLTCSFNTILPIKDDQYLCDFSHIPHWSILVDPSIYYRRLLKSPFSIVSCVDHFDCEFVRSLQFQNVFFWPHAVEQELSPEENQERPYDVVFLGSCYDHENLRHHWRKILSKKVSQAVDDAIELVLQDEKTPLISAVRMALLYHQIDSHEVDFDQLVFYVDNYMRGKDRVELIQAIKEVKVTVFGGTCWRDEPPVSGWAQQLASSPNVQIHPAIPFAESLEILKKSKICLNSMPFFKNGTHERIFTGLACGSLPITTDNLWIRDNFKEGQEIVLYRPFHWDEVNDKVHHLLNHEVERQNIVQRGREKVMAEHTWDKRVEQFLQSIKPILENIRGIS